ncbi:hypothetical protein [Deinococcus kurensis]|uniref:hypothetical protein n=1 Tax=Deinococcus kurensis TaxID=2662757 RepID=UPI0012D2E186|nr:hypothetical protein [Deinococcus kurensis]
MTAFPHIPTATRCACCGIELKRGGYLVPAIGAVGPTCQHKFAPLAQAMSLLEGRETASVPADARHITGALVARLRALGITVTTDTGTYHVGALTRKAAEVAKSYTKRRAELVRDLQIASGFYGAEAQAARAQAVAA